MADPELSSPRRSARQKRRDGLAAGAIVAMIVLAYLPAMRAGWIWDDDYYVTHNINLRSAAGLARLWTVPGAVPQYYPLTHTSFWIEYHLWGLRPLGFHLVNIALHAISAILLWLILRRLMVPGAWLIAAIWAIHPINVETVAWVTERKNVLSGVLYLLAMWIYLPMSHLPDYPAATGRRWIRYTIVLLFFIGSILSKSVTASFPAAVLLIIWWKRGRIRWRDIWPMIPMFALGLAMGTMTSWMERVYVGAAGPEFAFTFADRILIAGRALWFYAGKLLWPVNLTFIYPRWQIDPHQRWQWIFPLAAALLVLAAWLMRRRIGRGPLAAILFFGGTLVPALGFVNVFPMRYSFVADHFQYLAGIGLIVLIVGSLSYAARRMNLSALALSRAIGAAVCAILILLSFQHARVFADSETLWRDTVARNPGAAMPRLNYGKWLAARGDFSEARRQYDAARRIAPNNPEMWANLGILDERQGRIDQAVDDYHRALRGEPGLRVAMVNLGQIQLQRGNLDEAQSLFGRAMGGEMPYAAAYRGMGLVRLRQGRLNEAADLLGRAVALDPDDPAASTDLAGLMLRLGRLDDAEAMLRKTLAAHPDDATAHNTFGLILASRHQLTQAGAQFRAAIRLNPRLPEAYNNLGAVLENMGQTSAAANEYRRALELRPDFAQARRNLARVAPHSPASSPTPERE